MRKQPAPRVMCYQCRKWMHYGKYAMHYYGADDQWHKVHTPCHLLLLRKEQAALKAIAKEAQA